MTIAQSLQDFVDEVGANDPISVVGGRTQWSVGGMPAPTARSVHAPAGIVEYHPAEMTVRLGAGTTMSEHVSQICARENPFGP